MPRGSRRAYHTGLSRDVIVGAALALTAERGLDGWSMRDLTGRLDTSLSVIYHHVGDRDRLRGAVVDRIYADMDLTIDETDWRTALHSVLSAMIDHLARYRGVATWLLHNGPQTEQLVPVLETGMRLMLEAGWGEESAPAHSMAFNTCLGLIALGDRQPGDAADPGIPGLRSMLESHPSAGPGAEQMARMAARFEGDPTETAATRREYCRYALDRVLDGLEVRLRELRAHAPTRTR
ncbi:TetR/AcrR family transcriptional regulator [Nocardia mexicana]|uniref:TetR family transcriptional regulator n=1 Tax=Nocardia mexicana TaxID=279262 RepID=A0A370H8U2_9NOCA|nr:TetR/AcrR family transcriptional regulator [Nocardia mexicana]RDI53092.1 TetR family transcriptional regulator [Nocardia mexicana]